VTSERQIAANRANALHSTGPKTSEGKAAVRLNASRHGLLARDVVLPEEDLDAFDDLQNRVRAELSPVGPIEELFADRVINIMWRLGRSARAETALFDWRVRELQVSKLANQVRSHEAIADLCFSTHIADKAAHTEATEALARAKQERDRDAVLLGRAFDADAKESDALGARPSNVTELEN
jgi:transposase InsO family protein